MRRLPVRSYPIHIPSNGSDGHLLGRHGSPKVVVAAGTLNGPKRDNTFITIAHFAFAPFRASRLARVMTYNQKRIRALSRRISGVFGTGLRTRGRM